MSPSLASPCPHVPFQHLDALLTTLIVEANKPPGEDRDSQCDLVIGRFMRSVIRIYTLITIAMPIMSTSAGSAGGGVASAYGTKDDRRKRRAFLSPYGGLTVTCLIQGVDIVVEMSTRRAVVDVVRDRGVVQLRGRGDRAGATRRRETDVIAVRLVAEHRRRRGEDASFL